MAGSPNEDSEGSRITYVKGDLFACPQTDSLVHCISEDCRMGAGIAVLFKKKFGGVQELLNQRKKSGEVAVLKRDERYIYYLTTKNVEKLTSCRLRSRGGGYLVHWVRNIRLHPNSVGKSWIFTKDLLHDVRKLGMLPLL